MHTYKEFDSSFMEKDKEWWVIRIAYLYVNTVFAGEQALLLYI